MANLIPRSASPRESTGALSQFSRPELRAMTRAQNAEIARGGVVAARLQAGGMAAATGMQMVGMLSREANFLADGDPAAAAQLQHLADCYAEYAAWEIRQYRNG